MTNDEFDLDRPISPMEIQINKIQSAVNGINSRLDCIEDSVLKINLKLSEILILARSAK